MILNVSPDSLERAVAALRKGECVGLPTETVYGLAADGLNPAAVARIFEVKNRPVFDPLILHVTQSYELSSIVSRISDPARRLIEHFWPGPLTLVLNKQPRVPDLVTSGLETVAVRCPDHPVARQLLELFQGPLAAPSANPFGRLSPTTALAVEEELGDRIALTLDGGPCRLGIESTIVDCSADPVKILRLGAIPVEELEKVAGRVEVIRQNTSLAPGMLEHHYAPRTPLYLCDSLMAGALPMDAAALRFSGEDGSLRVKVLSPGGDLKEAAMNLFSYLRELDQSGVRMILAEWVSEEGLGRAINDRLRKASAGTATWGGKKWILGDRTPPPEQS
jgi:L-threonylcarbamoyladenylate synthase